MEKKGDFNADPRILLTSSLAVLIGCVCGLIAKVLIWMIGFFTNLFFFQKISFDFATPTENHLGLAVVIVPIIGGIVIGLMARYGSERIRGHGIPEALEAILFGKSRMQPKVAVLKPLSSAISIGSGGPFGAEGPIIMTGGAFGSIIAQFFHLTAQERKTLLVAGAAAGMSATFASPVAAVLLAVELLLFEWKPRSMIPVAIASAMAAIVRVPLFGPGPLFPVPAHAPLATHELFNAALVGLIAGVLSAGLSGLVYWFEDMFTKLPIHWMWWPAIGGLAIGIGGYFQPRALGVGYDIIADLLKGSFTPSTIISLVLIKGVIWAIALGSGTSGGVLAPLLIMGGGVGVLEAHLFSASTPALWPLISMAAVLGGMMRSPFTGTIFAFELTQDVNALLPLMIASVMGYAVTVMIMKRSILTEKVVRRGYHIFREYSVDVLEQVSVAQVMTKDVECIPQDMRLSKVLSEYFGKVYRHSAFPVTDENKKLLGIITYKNVRDQSSGRENLSAVEACESVKRKVYADWSCKQVVELMANEKIVRLPVVDEEKGEKIIGIVTLHDVMKPYAQVSDEERVRERFIRAKRRAVIAGSPNLLSDSKRA